MTTSDQMFRMLLLLVCVGLWVAALPAFARGIVGPAFTRDLLSAGSLGVAAVFHTLSVILFASLVGRHRHSWS